MNGKTVPLCVDLDGTLIKSDVLWESLVQFVIQYPVRALLVPIWLVRGKAYLKSQIAASVDLAVETLPINEDVMSFIRAQQIENRSIILVTASAQKYADQIAKWLNLFDAVFATSDTVNLSSSRKRDRLVEEFGESGFDYIGNSRQDHVVWQSARKAIVANAWHSVAAKAVASNTNTQVLSTRRLKLATILRAVRPHQWVKNVLVFVPLFVSHTITNTQSVLAGAFAFVAFTLCAATVYLMNDIVDVSADRRHKTKRSRPIAAGDISIALAAFISALLLPCALIVALYVSPLFLAALATYFVLTAAYSFYLKKKVLLDVLTLAALYTMRIVGGAIAINVMPSFWLLAFSIFLFLSLALIKRYSELLSNQNMELVSVDGRGYTVADLPIIGQFGTVSGYLSVLVLALYINSDAVVSLYRQPEYLWLICPAMLYWISLIWMLAARGKMNEDPVIFAITDFRSYVVALSVVIFVYLGT